LACPDPRASRSKDNHNKRSPSGSGFEMARPLVVGQRRMESGRQLERSAGKARLDQDAPW